ncbi:hypothetical protein [Gilliamella sp. CG22]|uniref:hypothetical protein n=1 Tax=Gilliamella sp. CG22 TaxID=3351504 RepID=UPI0039869A5D
MINVELSDLPVRVELSHLQVIQGFYFLNDVLFSGLAYDHREQKLHKVYQMTEGKITGEQAFGFFKHSSGVKIDFAVIEDDVDYEFRNLVYYQGELLNGVTYEYCDGFVLSESLWVDGWEVELITWYVDGSGLVRRFELDYDENRSNFKWDYKRLISVDCTKGDINSRSSFTISVNEQNQINSFVLDTKDTASLEKLVQYDDLPLPANSLSGLLAYYPLAEKVSLNIFSDENFIYFAAHTNFQPVKRLRIVTEHLSLALLTKSMDLPQLTWLFFDEYGISDYSIESLPEDERLIKQKECDTRNHALITLLLAIQAKYHGEIKLNANSGIMFRYIDTQGELMMDVNQHDFSYLLDLLPNDKIVDLHLRQRKFPIVLLEKLSRLTHLKRLCLEEGVSRFDGDNPSEAELALRSNARNQALWGLLKNLQLKLHCDIELISETSEVFKEDYQGE